MSTAMVPFDDSSIITDVPDAPTAPVKASTHLATGFGIAASNAAESHFWARRVLSSEWDRMSARGKKNHIDHCPDTCSKCADHRVFGSCSSCGDTTEEVAGESRCCGSAVILGGVS